MGTAPRRGVLNDRHNNSVVDLGLGDNVGLEEGRINDRRRWPTISEPPSEEGNDIDATQESLQQRHADGGDSPAEGEYPGRRKDGIRNTPDIKGTLLLR